MDHYSDEHREFDVLPKEKDAEVNAHWEKFYALLDEKDYEKAEAEALKAWKALPEPKTNWDYYSNSIPMNLMTFYRDQGKFDEARHWLEVARDTYGPGPNVSVEFVAATIDFERGALDEAFEEFDRQYETFGKRAFQGEDSKYLDFTMERRGKK